ncbi:Nucleotidyltransferase [Byssothecium circinans]|uniref:Nucleotidyltransferase n=1 Tax=Byssothecium circinans TaxID=147558 RepID=A0A6A5UEJ7_9PLEO|nr:Nucleotidyltransferase [Byssothecium circinans]
MKPHRVRQICRSHNRFAPSIALWQHFVLPCHPLRQQRLLSTASEAASLPEDGSANLSPLQTPSTIEPLADPTASPATTSAEQRQGPKTKQDGPTAGTTESNKEHTPLIIRRLRGSTPPGKVFSPAAASIRKELDAKVHKITQTISEQMKKARLAFDGQEDYEGVPVNAMASSAPTLQSTLPWVVPLTPELQRDSHTRLSLEITKFHEYAKPSRTEALARRQIVEQVREHAREVLPDYVLEVFGSERTGLALATSDIDLRLKKREDLAEPESDLPPSPLFRRHFLDDLYKLHRNQFRDNPAYLMPMLRHARYPLITMQDRASSIDIQIVLSNDTSLARDAIHRYMQEYPYLRPTYTLVRTIFESRGLADVFRGGFGSYSIFMMLVAALRHKPPKKPNAAGALYSFLQFWSTFDTTTSGVSIEPPELFDKVANPVMPDKTKQQIIEGSIKPLPPYMLCLRDPADETNDLGRKGICIKHVIVTLRHLLTKLNTDLKKNTRHSLILPMVGDIYALNIERRKKLDNHGHKVLNDMQQSFAETARRIREEEQAERLPGEAS